MKIKKYLLTIRRLRKDEEIKVVWPDKLFGTRQEAHNQASIYFFFNL